MNPNSWLGLTHTEATRLASRITSGPHEPIDVLAAVAASVIIEPGDGVWGEYAADTDHATVIAALVSATSAIEFANELGVQCDGVLANAWERWSPRLSQHAMVNAIEHAAHLGARLLLPTDPGWPAGFFDLGPHMPVALYVRGRTEDVEWSRGISLVGARAATGYGEHVASEIAADLASSECVVISGAAYGIDGVAHRAALAEGQPTAAFLAGGIDRLYPSGHSELFAQIIQHGSVFSETPCGTAPSKFRFLQRNRLIAAAARAVVVVEAGRRSGSLNTAGHAAALGRPLGAVPGPITSPSSAGCHYLLREGAASCVTSADEVRELVWGSTQEYIEHSTPSELLRVKDALSNTWQTTESVASTAGLGVRETAGWLSELHLMSSADTRDGRWRRKREP
ncbi:MAG: DNA-processing protein DprA [Agromyces sp.]